MFFFTDLWLFLIFVAITVDMCFKQSFLNVSRHLEIVQELSSSVWGKGWVNILVFFFIYFLKNIKTYKNKQNISQQNWRFNFPA